ncbi:hypothetical protein FQ330_03935 [Agrococcus sediminis]|uniref:Uncharacterized protein n=1 Tax=Agrococcus sediminis TaxID=2599924 RepID=A0A5M8QIY6_9MICO|nr:hypothetical protein [Agrococcus sediminis]KAA6434924.1 hypothetical protein FQ330_03935 [Agrococcus sediminis]
MKPRITTMQDLKPEDIGHVISFPHYRPQPGLGAVTGELVGIDPSTTYKGNMPVHWFSVRLRQGRGFDRRRPTSYGPFAADYPVTVGDTSTPPRPRAPGRPQRPTEGGVVWSSEWSQRPTRPRTLPRPTRVEPAAEQD